MRVDDLRYCEEGGVEAAIHGETVLMGSAYFMKKRHVALPTTWKLQTGLFLSVDGVLTAVFAVKYQPSRNAEWALRAMRRCHITPVLAVRSSNVTPGLIKRKFGVDAKVVYPTCPPVWLWPSWPPSRARRPTSSSAVRACCLWPSQW